MEKKTALIAGGNGVAGSNLAKYLTASPDWEVIITSRTKLNYETSAHFLALDLDDPEFVIGNEDTLKDVTHVFFASYTSQKTLELETSANAALFKNLIRGVETVAPQLAHVTLIQGGKAYGAHLGKTATPAYETARHHFPPNFYYEQEEFLKTESEGKNWKWTVMRPDGIIGMAIGNPMNLGTLIAIYAVLCKELDVPMRFPGPEATYNMLSNVTDAILLAKGMEFAALNPAAHGEVFNITNGDIFRWKHIWPKFGAYFGVEVDEPQTFSLTAYMADKKPVWDRIVKKYNLADYEFDKLVQWGFGDFLFNATSEFFMDVSKLRRIGFQEMHVDTFASFKRLFDELKEANVIPA